jgi:hypothetical protein
MSHKVVILIPTYNGNRNWELFSTWLERLNPQPSLYIFLENNSSDGTLVNLVNFKLPHEIIRIWMRDDLNEVLKQEHWEYTQIAHIRQLLLTRAKQLDPDYAIFLDDDTLPPHDLITKVVNSGKDILGGCYVRIFPEGTFLATKFYHTDKKARDRHAFMLVNLQYVMSQLGTSQYYKQNNYVQYPYVEVPMTSGGCLALSRRCLKHPQLFFYPNPTKDINDIASSEDFGYCIRARRMGIRTYLDLQIICRHLIDIRYTRSWALDDKGVPIPFKWS